MLGSGRRERKRRARLLCWVPYAVVGGAVMTGAALLNAAGLEYAFTSALATVGGTFLLVWIPVAAGPEPVNDTGDALVIRRSSAWLIAGLAVAAFLGAAFGPGIEL